MQPSISQSAIAAHLPAWLNTAIQTGTPVRVDFTGPRFVEIYPAQRRFVSDCSPADLADLWTLSPQRITPLPEVGLSAQEARPLGQLHWALVLRSVQGQPRHRHFRFSLVHLQSWPQLSDVPVDVLPMVARICALLARRPTTVSLVPLLLDLPQDEVFALIEVVRLYGHLHMEGPAQDDGATADPLAATAQAAEPTGQTTGLSLVRKIWQRLLGGRGG